MGRFKATLKRKLIFMILLFLAANIASLVLLSRWKAGKDLNLPSAQERSRLTKEANVTILGRPWNKMMEDLDQGKAVPEPTKIDRPKAAELALEQTAAMIKYLFAAAAGFLGFLAKVLIDSESKEDRSGLPTSSLLLSVAAALSFLSSMFGGLAAQGWFLRLATLTQFSLIREFGVWVLYQQVFLFLGVVFVLFSAIPLIVNRPTPTRG